MNHRFLALLGGLVLACWLRGAIAPAWGQPPEKPVAPIYPVINAITVDGNIVDWEWAPSFGFAKFAFPIVIPDYGQVASFMARYDAQALYVAFKVNDDTPAVNRRRGPERWEGDQIELLLCTDPQGHAQHSYRFTEYDYQLFLGPHAEGPPDVYVLQNAKQQRQPLAEAQAGVQVWPDGKGWSLEARLPWASLNRPDYFRPEPGVQIPWQIQIDQGSPEGDILGHAAKWHPFGIHFQDPTTWAWARFLDAQETILPPAVAEEEGAEPVGKGVLTFRVPTAGLVSVNVVKEDGTVIRRVVVGERLEAGEHTATWDGRDEQGRPVEPGTYRFAGAVTSLGVKYLTTIGNTSPEPYGGIHRSEGGEYRHGAWHDVIVNSDGTFYVLNDGGEGPPSMQLIDPANQYRVKWGGGTAITGNDFQQAGARDGDYLYFTHYYGYREGNQEFSGHVLSRMKADTHQSVRFGNGEWTVKISEAFPVSRWEVTDWEVRGLGAAGGKVYVPLFRADRVDIYDGEQGTLVGALSDPSLDGPADVAVAPDGTIYVVDRRAVHRFSAEGRHLGLVAEGLRQGWSVALAPQGNVVVSDFGSHEVKVFDPAGRLLKTLGNNASLHRGTYYTIWDGWRWNREREYFGGPLSDDSFFRPQGLGVDGQGNLILADTGNARVQCFDANYRLQHSLIAQIYPCLAVDPEKPETVFLSSAGPPLLRQYQINWATGEHRLVAHWTPVPDAPFCTEFVKFRGDQPYFFTNYCRPVWTIENGRVRMCSSLGVAGYGGWGYGMPLPLEEGGQVQLHNLFEEPEWKDDPPVAWEWRDSNRDGLPQLAEYTFYRKAEAQPWWRTAYPANYFVDEGWNVQGKVDEGPEGRYLRLPFGGFDEAGNPIYSWKTAQLVFEGQKVDPEWTADLSGGKPQKPQLGGGHFTSDGWMYLILNDRPEFNPRDCRFRAYSPEGRRLFSLGHATRGFWDKPGYEISFCTQMPRPLGEFVFTTDAMCAMHVFTRDGLFAGTLLDSADRAPGLGGTDARYQPWGEMWWAHVFRHPQTKRVYLIAQPNAQPLVLLYEITGIDQVQRFAGEVTLKPLGGG